MTTGDQGEQGEDEEVKHEVTQDEIFAVVQQFRKDKGKKTRAKERRKHAGIVVKAITTAETARMTNRTTAGQMAGRGRIRKAARQAKMQAKDIGRKQEQFEQLVKQQRKRLVRAWQVLRMARSAQTEPLEHAGVERQEQHEKQ